MLCALRSDLLLVVTKLHLAVQIIRGIVDINDVFVSVIIPAWRLADELTQCLSALDSQEGAPRFEVVVVVNGADPKVKAAANHKGLKTNIITTPVNIGFGWACNIGAAQAAGNLLVFLNDDTIPYPDWLQNLTNFTVDNELSVTSSLLLNEDGTIAEAGSQMHPDGMPTPLGAGQTVAEAKRSGLLAPRILDYGSGAALMVRADMFREVGGFDSEFSPAYYEDTDFQFRLREKGLDVWLVPSAVVIHHTNRSTHDRPSWLRFSIENGHSRFVQRWENVLKDAPERGASVDAITPIPEGRRKQLSPLPHEFHGEDAYKIAEGHNERYIAWLEKEYSRLNALVEAQNHQIAQRQLVLDDTFSTLSWRITRPIRLLKKLAYRLTK